MDTPVTKFRVLVQGVVGSRRDVRDVLAVTAHVSCHWLRRMRANICEGFILGVVLTGGASVYSLRPLIAVMGSCL